MINLLALFLSRFASLLNYLEIIPTAFCYVARRAQALPQGSAESTKMRSIARRYHSEIIKFIQSTKAII